MASKVSATIETLLGVDAKAGNTRLGLANSILSGMRLPYIIDNRS